MVMVQKVQGALKRKKNAGGTINNVKPHDVIQVGKSIFVALKRCLSEPEMARLLDTIDDTSLAASDLSEVLMSSAILTIACKHVTVKTNLTAKISALQDQKVQQTQKVA